MLVDKICNTEKERKKHLIKVIYNFILLLFIYLVIIIPIVYVGGWGAGIIASIIFFLYTFGDFLIYTYKEKRRLKEKNKIVSKKMIRKKLLRKIVLNSILFFSILFGIISLFIYLFGFTTGIGLLIISFILIWNGVPDVITDPIFSGVKGNIFHKDSQNK